MIIVALSFPYHRLRLVERERGFRDTYTRDNNIAVAAHHAVSPFYLVAALGASTFGESARAMGTPKNAGTKARSAPTTTGKKKQTRRGQGPAAASPSLASPDNALSGLTANWFDRQEVETMQRVCVRRGLAREAVQAAIERDLSGDGRGVFASLVTSCIEDIGLASPMALVTVLISFNLWEGDMAAQRFAAAHADLVATVDSVARWPKSRMVVNAATKTMGVNPDVYIKDTSTEAALKEMGGHTMLIDSIEWLTRLAEPAPSARRAANTAAIGAGGRLDAERVITMFAGMVQVATEAWSNAADQGVCPPADLGAPKESESDVHGETVDANAGDPAREPCPSERQQSTHENDDGGENENEKNGGVCGAIVQDGGGNDDKDKRAMEEDAEDESPEGQGVVSEGVILTIEESALMLAHGVLALEQIEGRRVEWTTKGSGSGAQRPAFIDEAMKAINAGPGSDMAKRCWPTVASGSRACRDLFARPSAWIFAPLLAVARGAECVRLVMSLLAIVETLACNLVSPRAAITAAVLETARHSVLSWEEHRIDIQKSVAKPEIVTLMASYERPTLASLADRTETVIIDKGTLAAARSFAIDPERHLDGATRRDNGASTLDVIAQIQAFVAARRAPSDAGGKTVGIASIEIEWTPDETRKSHGPALCDHPSDARLASAATIDSDAARASGDPIVTDAVETAQGPSTLVQGRFDHYVPEDEADAAACVRAWFDKGNAVAAARYPIWVQALPDTAFKCPTPPASALKKAAAAAAAAAATTTTTGAAAKKRTSARAKNAPTTTEPEPAAVGPVASNAVADEGVEGVAIEAAAPEKKGRKGARKRQAPADGGNKKQTATKRAKTSRSDATTSADPSQIVLATVCAGDGQVAACDALQMLRPGKLLRIVRIVYEEVDDPSATTTATTTGGGVERTSGGVQLCPIRPTPQSPQERDGVDTMEVQTEESAAREPSTSSGIESALVRVPTDGADPMVADESGDAPNTGKDSPGKGAPKGTRKKAPRSKTTATTATQKAGNKTRAPKPPKKLQQQQTKQQQAGLLMPDADLMDVAGAAPTDATANGARTVLAPHFAPTRQTSSGSRSRSRTTDMLIKPPDLDVLLKPVVLDADSVALLATAPLAQKPTLTTKKCVYMLADGAYKGPYLIDHRADVIRVVRTLYREYVMRRLWGDEIVAHHEPVLDSASRSLYLRLALVGDCGPDKWETNTCTIRRDGAQQEVAVVNRESHGLVIINNMDWLESSAFVEAFPRIVIHMGARYIIGGGDANLNNIIGCPARGASSVTAVDIEDNRDCSKKKKKKPTKGDPQKAQRAATGTENDGAASDPAADGEKAASGGGAGQKPTLMRCLFAPGRGPKADEQPTFDTLLTNNMGPVRRFIDRVRDSLGSGADSEGIEAAAQYARSIGYNEAAASEIPTRGKIAERLAILEACLDEFEGSTLDTDQEQSAEDGEEEEADVDPDARVEETQVYEPLLGEDTVAPSDPARPLGDE